MIRTKYGSRVSIVGRFPTFRSQDSKTLHNYVFERALIEFQGSGRQTWANISDLRESEEGEIEKAIAALEEGSDGSVPVVAA